MVIVGLDTMRGEILALRSDASAAGEVTFDASDDSWASGVPQLSLLITP
jgi:hypothetical protein